MYRHSSGFLYHPQSQKILLQRDSSAGKSEWTLLGGTNSGGFTEVITELLKMKLPAGAVRPVYEYVAKGKKYTIVYAEAKILKDFPATKDFSFTWFTPKEIAKLSLSAQTKQDIIVGHRVIDSQIRLNAGERTIG